MLRLCGLGSLRIVAIVVAIGMIPLMAVAWFVGDQSRLREREALDGQLVSVASAQRAALDAHFARARAVVLVTAQNPAFRGFYDQPGGRAGDGAAGGPVIERVNTALAYLEQLYPRSIGEASFIDRSGAVIARVTGGRRARRGSLSGDQSGAPFFTPTFVRPPGGVYQARPYRSPNTGEWVISNSTVVPDGAGRRRAIVHFEVTIDGFRRAAARAGGPFGLKVVDAATGRVVIDSEDPRALDAARGAAGRAEHARMTVPAGAPRVVDHDGRRIAVARLPVSAGNANQWYVVALAGTTGPSGALTLLHPWMAGLVVLLVVVGVVIARLWERRAREALTDPLTGLPNRRLLNDRLAQMIATARRGSEPAAVIVIDIDRFKDVNDTLGHDAGDRLLVEVARRLRAVLRESDTVARFGGDEFAVLAAVDGEEGALALAGRLRAALAAPLIVETLSIELEASFGIALFPAHGAGGPELLRAADVAMFIAKESRAGP